MSVLTSIRFGTGAAVAALALLAVSTAYAASPAITIGSAEAAVGGRAAVTLDALDIDAPGVGAWTIDIAYDRSLMHAVSCTATQDALSVCNAAFADDTARSAGAKIAGLAGDHTLASITFECDREGSSALSLSAAILVDATVGAPQPIQAAAVNGNITCTSAAPAPTATPVPNGFPPAGGGGASGWDAWGPFGWLIAGLAGAGLAWIASGALSAAFAPVPSGVAGSPPRSAPPDVSDQHPRAPRETNVIRLRVRDIDDFSAFSDALAELGRAPGVRGARAVRLERREGVFDVAVAPPMTSATLARVAERALRRSVRVDSES